MNLNDIQLIFNRAWALTFSKKKLLSVCVVLVMCGLLVIFFQGLAINSGQWISRSLTFLPIFICAGLLLSTGVILTRIYHDEIKKKAVSYRKIVSHSWDVIIGTAYLTLPLILGYLLLWMLLGIFFLLNDIPSIGGFFGVILAFAPFLLNLGSLILCIISLSMLFFLTPIVALKGMNRMMLSQVIAKRFQENLFLNIFLAVIAVFPLLLLFALLSLTAFMTGSVCYDCEKPFYLILEWFFMMVPFAALLSPAVIFFFNFAAESHVLLQQRIRK